MEQKNLDQFMEHVSKESCLLKDEDGNTALMSAVLANKLKYVDTLLSLGSNPDQKNNIKLSPFIAAAANGHTQVFKKLLEYGPDINQVNRFGGTALLPSSEKGYLEVVQLAIDAGVPVNHINNLGWSALLEAVILGDDGFLYQDIIRELVVAGADINQKDNSNKNSIEYAKLQGKVNIIKILKQNSENNEMDIVRSYIRNNTYELALKKLNEMSETSEVLFYKGQIYERLGDYQQAKKYYQAGLSYDNQFYFYLAQLSRKMFKEDQALHYFNEAISQDQTGYFMYHKSNYLRDTGKHEEAVEIMTELLLEQPKRVDFMFHKANSLKTLGKYQAALTEMELASEIEPTNQLYTNYVEELKAYINDTL